MKSLAICLVCLVLSIGAAGQQPEATTVLQGLDPVELIEGKEVKGLESISVVRGYYRYLFSNEGNKQRFVESPEEHQIQFGGGCGRMGSLSGVGNPDRFYVFNRRIYIFASEGCRNSFKAAPEKHLEAPDPPPTGSPAEQKRAQELLGLALRGMGGAAKVDAVKTYQAKIKLGYKQGDKLTEYGQTKSIAFPGQYRDEYDWGTSKTGEIMLPGLAVSFDSKRAWEREEPVRAALTRAFYREPLAILKARKAKNFTAVAAGRGKIGDAEVEYLKVGIDGATSTLAIDPQSGKILQIAYRDRQNVFGDVVQTFSDFRPVDGLNLPFKVEKSFDGKPVASPSIAYQSIALNGNLDEALFRKPQQKISLR